MSIDWNSLLTGIVGLIIGGALTWLAQRFMEKRRKIRHVVKGLYFGPALNYHGFMGRNYPSEDEIGLDFTIKFFSEKSQTEGFNTFQLELGRSTFLRFVPLLPLEPNDIIRDVFNKNTPYELGEIELPPRQWFEMSLRCSIPRASWEAHSIELRSCNTARLSCKTARGNKHRFSLGKITFPEMPPAGLRGTEYMSLNAMSAFRVSSQHHPPPREAMDCECILMAARAGVMNLLNVNPEDRRFWNGDKWAHSAKDAKVYSTSKEARSEGERLKLWNNVPEEWIADKKQSQDMLSPEMNYRI